MNQDAITELQKPLDPKHVSERTQAGRQLSYIEGWHAIAEANRIFGHDSWDRETVYLKEVCRYEVPRSRGDGNNWKVGYEAKVRISVGNVVREGTGYGSGTMPDLYDAMESAGKEAETDAMKRALMTLGNPFGLALYDKTRANVQAPTPPVDLQHIVSEGNARANEGMAALTHWFKGLPKHEQDALTPEIRGTLKICAQEADKQKEKDAAE